MVHNLTARCMKCREQKEIKDLQITTTKNNRKAATGICPVCGTKLFRFLPKDFTIKHYPENEPDVKTEVKIETNESNLDDIQTEESSIEKKQETTNKENKPEETPTEEETKPENTEKEIKDFDKTTL